MSEAARHGEHPTDAEKQRIAEELRRIQALHFFRHSRALFDDALQRQILSAREAKDKGLNFVDIYTQETSVKVPQDRAIAILLTPDGDWLRPTQPKPHFYIYFSTIDSNQDSSIPIGLISWIEKVDADGSSALYTVTEEGIQRAVTDTEEGVVLLLENQDQDSLTPLMTKDLLDEIRSFRLAPLEHAAIKQ
jgi:hypothetical protein